MGNRILEKCMNDPSSIRVLFIILLFFSVILNGIILEDSKHFFILYIFAVIFLGLGFSDKPKWFLFAWTTVVVTCRHFLIPDADSSRVTYVLHLMTYFLITLISSNLMRYVHKVKDDNLELTTSLANALDSRDNYTMNHSENVARYALQIAERMNLSKECQDTIHQGALLHDIGKIGVPEHILLKSGRLTVGEYEAIKSHPVIGFEMIKHVGDFKYNGVLDIVLYHHERFDGKGYPEGLKGCEIPLLARIVAIADSFDAMTSRRVYREKLDVEYALNEIHRGKGTQFDPEITDVFLALFNQQDTDPLTNRINA